MENGVKHEIVQNNTASKEAKDAYLKMVWAMDKEAMFKELCRVHAESAQLLINAQAEIERLKKIIATPFASNDPKH